MGGAWEALSFCPSEAWWNAGWKAGLRREPWPTPQRRWCSSRSESGSRPGARSASPSRTCRGPIEPWSPGSSFPSRRSSERFPSSHPRRERNGGSGRRAPAPTWRW